MRRRATEAAVGAIVVVLGIVGVVALRDATISNYERMPADTEIELVLQVHRNGGNERPHSDAEVAEALVLNCRLEVSSDLVEPMEDLGDGVFRGVLVPSMNSSDRRQFRGCLEDWVIDHLTADVLRLEEIG